jgi:hypothetical protein
VKNFTDGGAFDVVEKVSGKAIDAMSAGQLELLKSANSLVERSITSSANIANQSLSQAMQIKAGQTVSDPANQNLKEAGKIAFAGLAAYLIFKTVGGAK